MRALCLPTGIRPEELREVDEVVFARRRLRRGEHLYRAGEPFKSFYAFRSGFFKTYVDGPQGVRVEEPHRALQRFMLTQREAGMLLCLCSKNNPDDVFDTFRAHPEMPLALEHFTASRLSWGPKSGSLRSLAEELNISLDSFILVDNSPTECAEVQADSPEVLTIPLPAHAHDFAGFLDHVWAFDRWSTTAEDRQRDRGPRQPRRYPSPAVGQTARLVRSLYFRFADLERDLDEPNLRQPSHDYIDFAYRWASGESLESIPLPLNVDIGDAIKAMKGLYSLLRQLEWAVRNQKLPVAGVVAEAVAAMERDVIKRT